MQTPLTTSAPIPGATPAPATAGRRTHPQLPLDSPAPAPAPAAVAAPTSGAMPRCPFHAALGHGTAAPASSLPHPPAWNPHQQPQGHARPGAADAGRVASAAATEERERLEPQGLGGAEAEGQPSYNQQSHIATGEVDEATAAGATAAVASSPMAYMQSKGVWGGGSCPSLPTLAMSQPVAQQQEPVMLFLGTPRIGSVDELRVSCGHCQSVLCVVRGVYGDGSRWWPWAASLPACPNREDHNYKPPTALNTSSTKHQPWQCCWTPPPFNAQLVRLL